MPSLVTSRDTCYAALWRVTAPAGSWVTWAQSIVGPTQWRRYVKTLTRTNKYQHQLDPHCLSIEWTWRDTITFVKWKICWFVFRTENTITRLVTCVQCWHRISRDRVLGEEVWHRQQVLHQCHALRERDNMEDTDSSEDDMLTLYVRNVSMFCFFYMAYGSHIGKSCVWCFCKRTTIWRIISALIGNCMTL